MLKRLDSLLMIAGAAVFALATTAMLAGREPFATWYYSFAWWSYILVVDARNHRRTGRSVLLHRAEAPQTLALSIIIWAFFETYNFRLGNWYYLEIPSNPTLRWLGYSVAYATVLPGIFVTAELLKGWWPPRSTSGVRLPENLVTILFWTGLAGSVLPWIWPTLFFPLVWLGPTASFMAINVWLGREGILHDIAQHGYGKLVRLAAAGVVCGFLWECWNYWAVAKWVYEVPFLSEHPLFEMPLAGFLGFPPFAIACHEMAAVARKLLQRVEPYPVARLATWLVLAIAVGLAYRGIDAFTVRTFQP